MVINETTKEGKVFDLETDGAKFNNFLRKAVLDFIADVDVSIVSIGKDKNLIYDANYSEEPIFWLAASIQYMQCCESGDWGDIATIRTLDEED